MLETVFLFRRLTSHLVLTWRSGPCVSPFSTHPPTDARPEPRRSPIQPLNMRANSISACLLQQLTLTVIHPAHKPQTGDLLKTMLLLSKSRGWGEPIGFNKSNVFISFSCTRSPSVHGPQNSGLFVCTFIIITVLRSLFSHLKHQYVTNFLLCVQLWGVCRLRGPSGAAVTPPSLSGTVANFPQTNK